MRFVIDEDLPRSLSMKLGELGHAIFDVRDHGLRGKSDEAVFRFAQKKNAILVSGDLDFANIIRFPVGSHRGIIILRFPNEVSVRTINRAVSILLSKISDQDMLGSLIVLTPQGFRIRRK